MGHIHLPTLPTSAKWRAVVDSLGASADAGVVAALSMAAAEKQLGNVSGDRVYREALRLLALAPMAARAEAPGPALRDLGLDLSDAPDLTDLVFAACDRLDAAAAASGQADDFGELTRRALVSAVSACVGGELPGLVEPSSSDVMRALRRFSEPREFTRLARAFYTKLLAETLSSFLDRAMAQHVGPGARFAHLGERSAFDDALRAYCFETTRIVHEFSSGWYGKHAWRGNGLSEDAVRRYGHVALKKIVEELIRRERGA